MGYTVYYTQNRHFTTQEWGLIREAAINMFNRLKQIKGSDGTGRPLIDNTDIIFNGDASKEEDHETFQLSKCGNGFNFCKTAHKPYDRYVKAMLVIANFFAPGALDISCDGDNEPDCWTEGVRIATIYVKETGRSPCSPLEAKRFAKMTESAIAASNSFKPTKDTKELEKAIKKLHAFADFFNNKTYEFLANYLEANIDDIKDAYQEA